AEKLDLGYPPRDALATGLFALDYEKDDYDTPRIAGVIGETAYVGIVRQEALLVKRVEAPTIVATYETDAPEPFDFGAETAEEAARAAFEAGFEHPVAAAGVARTADGFDLAIYNG
ncbi:MAG: IMP cyclohydrolase, partial [Halodesulfurarchaeum sp.]